MKLTEKEFDVIIEALEKLPNRSCDGDIMRRVLVKTLSSKLSEEKQLKVEDEMKMQELKEEADRKAVKKTVDIISGKLYVMRDEIVED